MAAEGSRCTGTRTGFIHALGLQKYGEQRHGPRRETRRRKIADLLKNSFGDEDSGGGKIEEVYMKKVEHQKEL